MDVADRAMAFVQEMRADGYPAVVIFVDEVNAVRMLTPQMSVVAMTLMLDKARDIYADHARRTLN